MPELVCKLNGFLHVFIGCFQIYSITALSIVRYNILRDTKELKIECKKKIFLKATIICILLSIFWAGAPLLGWSHYSLEENMLCCSVEHFSKEFSVVSYNFIAILFTYAIPICIIILKNFESIILVFSHFY